VHGAGTLEQARPIDLAAVDEDVRVRVRRDGAVALPDPIADLGRGDALERRGQLIRAGS
jgi:hypothetical protein